MKSSNGYKEDCDFICKYKSGFTKSKELCFFLKIFRKEISKSCEFSFKSLSENVLELTIEECDSLFRGRIMKFLSEIKRRKKAELYKKIASSFLHASLAKASFSSLGLKSFSVYSQTPITLADLRRRKFLARRLDEHELAEYMRAFESDCVFIGIDFFPFRVIPYFILSARTFSRSEYLSVLMSGGKYSSAALKKSIEFLVERAKRDIFISLDVRQNKIKADFANIPVTCAFEIVKFLGFSTDDFKQAVEFAVFSNLKRFSYFSLASKNCALYVKYYFKKYYFEGLDESDILADQLRRIKFLR